MARDRVITVAVLGPVLCLPLGGCGIGSHTEGLRIASALVSADGRTITVAAQAHGGGCVNGFDLTATATSDDVRLHLTEHVSDGTCSAVGQEGPVSTSLPTPLAARTLIDEETGRIVSYIPGQDLAQPRWLPSGASAPQDAVLEGWTRIYTFANYRRLAPLTITENPKQFANPGQFARLATTAVRIRGHRARLVHQRATSTLSGETSVGWVADGYSIIVSSVPWRAHQRPLSPDVILRVARALRLPAHTS